jgi:hypothetical protein
MGVVITDAVAIIDLSPSSGPPRRDSGFRAGYTPNEIRHSLWPLCSSV